MSSLKSYADSYKVIAFKNCNPTYNGLTLKVGMTVSDPKLLRENWNSSSGSKYIKLQSTSNKTIHVITEPSNKKKQTSDDGFMTWLWNCFTGQRKCSSRAPENELYGGLSENLSQTFYVLISPNSDEKEPTLKFASNLEEDSMLRFSCCYDNQSYTFYAPLISNEFVLFNKDLMIFSTEEARINLRMKVDYISPTGNEYPITNSMNIILIVE